MTQPTSTPWGPPGSGADEYRPRHEPVMLREALEGLAVHPGGRYVDATAGLGGHSDAILEAAAPDGRLLAIDRDPNAIALTTERLSAHGDAVVVARGAFADIAEIAEAHDFSDRKSTRLNSSH